MIYSSRSRLKPSEDLPHELTPRLHLTLGRGSDAFLVVTVPEGAYSTAAAFDAYLQIGEALREHGLVMVQERTFGSLRVEQAVRAARREALSLCGVEPESPLNYLQGQPACGVGLAGILIHAVRMSQLVTPPNMIMDEGKPCGRCWETESSRIIVLQNIRGDGLASTPRDPPSQASRAIQKAEQLLREQGASFIHVLRTWFYLSQILSWYPDFNGARNVEYRRFGLLGDENARVRVPASTGIRAELSGAAACSLDLIAHLPRTEAHAPSIRTLENPGQQSAFRYGSAFSRAVAIESEQELMIQVSGTAAIDEAGKSLFAGDIRAQIACTLDKVEALLAQERVSVREICAATLFVKQSEHAPIVREVLQKRGLDGLPAVCVVADICREELLFEMDAEILAKPR